MKKLIFRYSSMNSGKSANLIMTHHNYKELGKKVIAVVPNQNKCSYIRSRLGVEVEAIMFSELKEYLNCNDVDCILVDEAQFLSSKQIDYLNLVSIYDNTTVICYGLRTTSNGKLFEGSERLLAIADVLEELPTLCFCGRKARMNLRLVDGEIDKSTEVIKLKEEQEVAYVSVCRKCFNDYYNGHKDNTDRLISKYDNTKKSKA